MKFVPASGAASRMFQSLLTLATRPEPLTPAFLANAAASGDQDCQQCSQLFAKLPQVAFADDLRRVMARDHLDLDTSLSLGQYHELLTYLLTPKGCGFHEVLFKRSACVVSVAVKLNQALRQVGIV